MKCESEGKINRSDKDVNKILFCIESKKARLQFRKNQKDYPHL